MPLWIRRTILLFSCLFWWTVLIVISPLVLFLLGIFIFWKYVLVKLLTMLVLGNRCDSWMDSCDSILALDSFWENPLGSIGQLLILEGPFNLEQFCTHFRETILEARNSKNQLIYQKLLQIPKQFCGYSFWETVPDFSLENHIKIIEDRVKELELRKHVEECMKSPFPVNQPLWELCVFQNYVPSEETDVQLTPVILRLHHVNADGYTYIKLIDRLTGNITPDYVPSNQPSFLRNLSFLFSAPYKMFELYRNIKYNGDCFTKNKTTEDFVISWKILPLNLLRSVRKKTGAHFAAVGISAFSGALEKYAKVNNIKGSDGLQEFRRILLPLPWSGHPKDRMANHWTMGIIKVPFGHDELSRLSKSEHELSTVINSSTPIFVHSFGTRLLALFPAFILKRFLKGNVGTGIVFSSVPGPSDKALWIGSNRIRSCVPLIGPQFSQTGIIELIHTYNDMATITIIANKDICSSSDSADHICEFVEAEFCKLFESIPAKENFKSLV